MKGEQSSEKCPLDGKPIGLSRRAGCLQPDVSVLVLHQGPGHWAMGARASLSSHGPLVNPRGLDLQALCDAVMLVAPGRSYQP